MPLDSPLDGPLDELASFLATPAKSGVYLTKNELIALARSVEASLRVSERRRMLADVLKSPGSPAELAALVERLRALTEEGLASYRSIAGASPAAARALAPWIDKASATIERLTGLAAEIRLP